MSLDACRDLFCRLISNTFRGNPCEHEQNMCKNSLRETQTQDQTGIPGAVRSIFTTILRKLIPELREMFVFNIQYMYNLTLFRHSFCS